MAFGLRRTTCCGMFELHGISHYENWTKTRRAHSWEDADPEWAMLKILVKLRDRFDRVDWDHRERAFPGLIVFSDAVRPTALAPTPISKGSAILVKTIKKYRLGPVQASAFNRNYNTGNNIQAFVWAVDGVAAREFIATQQEKK